MAHAAPQALSTLPIYDGVVNVAARSRTVVQRSQKTLAQAAAKTVAANRSFGYDYCLCIIISSSIVQIFIRDL